MFGIFSSYKDDYPLASPRALEAWLERQPVNSLLRLQEEAVELLKRLPIGQHKPEQSLIQAVFLFDDRLANLRVTLTAQYVASARNSTALEARLWNAMYGLVTAFISAYEYLLKESARHISERKWKANLPSLLGRLIYYRGLDGKFRLFRHEQWIPGRWRELHANYALACANQVEKIPLRLDNVEQTSRKLTIEEYYLRVLLQQLINTGNVTPPQIDWAVAQLPVWARGADLSPTPKTSEGFFIDLSSGDGLRRRAKSMVDGQFLYLDPTVLHTRIVQNVMAVRDDIESAPADGRRVLEEQIDVMNKLAPCYSLVFKPYPRRANRANKSGSARAVFGFKSICKTLAEIDAERARLAEHGGSYSYSETASMYVYGFISEEANKRRERDKKEATPPQREYGEPCLLVDRSATGCCLLAAVSQVAPTELGTLIALREDKDGPWELGIVRRIRKLTAAQIEIGAQLIASSVSRVSLRVERFAGQEKSGYSVDGVDSPALGTRVDGLYLESVLDSSVPAGRTLVLPAAEYKPTHQMIIEDGSEAFGVLLRKALERQPEWIWAETDMLGSILE
jgi:cyclic-di-GMP-binding protein